MKRIITSWVLVLISSLLLAQTNSGEVRIDLNSRYFIESAKYPGQVLDVAASATKPGTNVLLYSKHGGKNQQFTFIPAGGGYYYIESLLAERMVLDIADYGKQDGTNIQIVRRGVGTPAQKFKISARNGYVRITSAMGDAYSIGLSEKGRNIVSRTTYGNISELLFKLTKVGGTTSQASSRPSSSQQRISFRILNYNTLLLDKLAAGNYRQEYRAANMPTAIAKQGSWDVVVFNEAFSNDARKKLMRGMLDRGYPYATRVVDKSGNLTNGGVFISSRHNILATDMIVYSLGLNEDKLSNKGAIYAKIRKQGKIIHVFGTHLQADRGRAEAGVRAAQMRELHDFIARKTRGAKQRNEAVIIAGDLNFCYIKDRQEYQGALKILDASMTGKIPANSYTFDPHLNTWANYRYGGKEARQWLDYVLVGNGGIIPKSTQLQVFKFRNSSRYEISRENDPLGITGKVKQYDLSDHYGISANFIF
ncbi:MAG: RICIN domain-containing protein [Bacteroidota bacterium]